ncbi:patatin-like phospholipase family protein [Nocardia tengchongensis]|uniref:patatin-like phospholipase family protein n=1 Tax=Nocardia tengchongensis TaxID=2055889 RepID=UPI0033ED154A
MRTGESRAVVLGPGGVVGTAWSVGLMHGLREVGVDLAEAETIVGTSAGAIAAGMLISGQDLGARATRPTPTEPEQGGGDPGVMVQAMALARTGLGEAEEGRRDEVRREIGRLAMGVELPAGLHLERMRGLVGAGEWSHGGLRIPAIDVETGAAVVFTAEDGVLPYEAAAASSAIPGLMAPVEIGGRRYFDGGFRNGLSTDLAEGAAVVIEPLAHFMPGGAGDARVHIVPDEAGRAAIGTDFADATRWADCFAAGAAQAVRAADEIRAAW